MHWKLILGCKTKLILQQLKKKKNKTSCSFLEAFKAKLSWIYINANLVWSAEHLKIFCWRIWACVFTPCSWWVPLSLCLQRDTAPAPVCTHFPSCSQKSLSTGNSKLELLIFFLLSGSVSERDLRIFLTSSSSSLPLKIMGQSHI